LQRVAERKGETVAEVKLKGADDLVRLTKKPDLWVPPANTANYLGFVLKVLASSRYKNLFMDLKPEDLHSVLKIKVARCFFEGTLDLEEIVDLGAYATLLYLRTSKELVDPKSTAKEMVGQLQDISCGVVTFKQELDKLPKVKVEEKVEVKETPPPPPASVPTPTPAPSVGLQLQSGQIVSQAGVGYLGSNYKDEVRRLKLENEELERVKAEQTPTKLENGNCLLGLKCPKCGSLEPFDILLTCWTKVYDDGTDTANEHVWDNSSPCNCFKCNYQGKVGDFRIPEKDEVLVCKTTLLGVKHEKKAKKPKKKGAKCRTSKRTCSSTKRR
jgi:hypothetical protein